jgi:hypothetical protein
MFAGKPGGRTATSEPGPASAAVEAMSVVRGLIGDGIDGGLLARRDPERYAFLLLAWVQGIAALVSSGVIGPDTVGELVADSVTTFIRGSAG